MKNVTRLAVEIQTMRIATMPLLTALASVLSPTGGWAVEINTVLIDHPGNPPACALCEGLGSISSSYRMGKHEVTNAQYAEFLNAVAGSDPYMLYHPSMELDTVGGIIRSGSPGSFVYSVKPPAAGQGPGGSSYAYENKPVVYVSWFDAIRFANWLHNGQGNGSTEEGAYTILDGATDAAANLFPRNAAARWWLPNASEWFKAAFFDPQMDVYYSFPTGTNDVPNNNLPSADTGNSGNFNSADSYSSPIYTTGNPSYPLTDVGAYTRSASPFGTLDQMGNVTEWNEGPSRLHESFGGIIGRSWTERVYGEVGFPLVDAPGDDVTWSETGYIGFRVATVVPEPTTLALLMGFVSLAVQRDRKRGSECAGINRFGIGNESVLRRRFSQPLRPPAEGGDRQRFLSERPW